MMLARSYVRKYQRLNKVKLKTLAFFLLTRIQRKVYGLSHVVH